MTNEALHAIQVVGANLVPTSLQTQNLITETLLDLLASDHVFLIRLTNVDEISAADGLSTARMTYIMQKNTETPDLRVVRTPDSVVYLANSWHLLVGSPNQHAYKQSCGHGVLLQEFSPMLKLSATRRVTHHSQLHAFGR